MLCCVLVYLLVLPTADYTAVLRAHKANAHTAPFVAFLLATDDEPDDDQYPIWKGMSAFEAGECEAPPAGVIVVDPFCDYLGKRCIEILEEAGYAVVQASIASHGYALRKKRWHMDDDRGY